MNDMDLGAALRRIAMEVTRDNVLTKAREVVNLGFPAQFALTYLSGIVLEKEQHESPDIPSRATGRRRSTRRRTIRT